MVLLAKSVIRSLTVTRPFLSSVPSRILLTFLLFSSDCCVCRVDYRVLFFLSAKSSLDRLRPRPKGDASLDRLLLALTTLEPESTFEALLMETLWELLRLGMSNLNSLSLFSLALS
jgi:hypothetical protein